MAALTSVAIVAAVGAGGPGPEAEIGARRAIAAGLGDVDAALAELSERLDLAVEAGRRGAAAVVAGADRSPAEAFAEAAGAVAASQPTAVALADAIERLGRARRALDPAIEPLPPPPGATDLAAIAAQLETTGSAGEAFAEMRRRAEGVTALLAEALSALGRADPAAARELTERARSDLAALESWQIGALTLPVWLETVGAMIGAVERTVDAIEEGDVEAAEAAAAAISRLEADAPSADRALRIAIGEAGSALTAPALNSLANARAALDEVAAAVASVPTEAGP